jgi:hypothetical protein
MTWLRMLRLLASVAAEGLASLAQMVIFPWRRRRVREAVRRALAGAGRGGAARRGPVAPALVIAAAAGFGFLGSGCASSTFPGSSFEKQVDELGWSVWTMALSQFKDRPVWYESLADDTRDLVDLELNELPDSLIMLGW